MERLSGAIYKNEEQLALYGTQCDAQIQETKAIKEAVSEASLELEVSTCTSCADCNFHTH